MNYIMTISESTVTTYSPANTVTWHLASILTAFALHKSLQHQQDKTIKTNPDEVVLSIANLRQHTDAKYDSNLRLRWRQCVPLRCRHHQVTPGFTTRLSEQCVICTIQHRQQNSAAYSEINNLHSSDESIKE